MKEHILEKAIRIEKISDLIKKRKFENKEMLPSTSQWHRFRQVAMDGDITQIRAFLNERPLKKKTAKSWTFRWNGKNRREGQKFYEKLQELFLDPIEKAKDLQTIYRDTEFFIFVDLPEPFLADKLEIIKKLITRMAICEFIDQMLLFQDNLSFEKKTTNGIWKVEVPTNG